MTHSAGGPACAATGFSAGVAGSLATLFACDRRQLRPLVPPFWRPVPFASVLLPPLRALLRRLVRTASTGWLCRLPGTHRGPWRRRQVG